MSELLSLSQQPSDAIAPSAVTDQWYIIQTTSGQCEVVAHLPDPAEISSLTQWGPFATRNDAIAKRVGLIRSGKCHPA